MLRNWSCSWTVLALACAAVTAQPGLAAAQTTPDDIGRELASLRRELQALRAEVESAQGGADRYRPSRAPKRRHRRMALKLLPCRRR